ncbi:MAG: NADH-quinone oxidoreductase subunit M [Sedimenticola sp.]
MADTSLAFSAGLPLISLLIFLPSVMGLVIWILPDERKARWVGLVAGIATLLLSMAIVVSFDPSMAGFQLVERAQWIPSLGISYLVGVDGISLLFLPLSSLLFVGVIVASWTRIGKMPRLYYCLILLLESTTLGIFSSLDLVLFFLFWEMTLLPLYFLLSLWGIGPNRRYAAVKYTLMMLTGGVPLLVGFLLLAFNHADTLGLSVPGGLAFDYPTLLTTPVSPELQMVVFFLLLIGFAIKTPVFPFHTWLPALTMDGAVAVAAIMTGIKLGAFGLMRFAIPLAPQAAQELHWLLAGLAVVGILYGAVVALAQTNLRRMLAFSSISHVGLVLLGLASFNIQGIQGALFQLLNFTLISGGIFLISGFLHHRLGSTDVVSLGGVAHTMPLLAAFFFFFGLAGMGMPGTSGFPAELLILISALETHTGAGLAALFGVVLGAGYLLVIYRKAFLGPLRKDNVADAVDLLPRELALVLLFTVIILAAGLFPGVVFDLIGPSTEAWVLGLGNTLPLH